jgi:site-specific DNA-methyltransferase (cytosine-N4-specific)
VPLADVRVIEGDARELPGIDPGSVHLVVTSPPYPMVPQWDDQFAAFGARDFDAMHDLLAEAWRAIHRVLVPGGLLAVNVGDALRTTPKEGFRLWPNHAEILERCRALGFVALPYLLWKKPMNRPNAYLGSGFLPPNAYVTLDCEYILLFRKGALRAFRPRDPGRRESGYTRGERDQWFSQLWDVRAARQAGADGRRTGAFPEEIPRRLIRMFSIRGDTVLDPFAGTGTTLAVARALGRRAIGVELDPARAEALRRAFSGSAEPSGAPAPRPRRA